MYTSFIILLLVQVTLSCRLGAFWYSWRAKSNDSPSHLIFASLSSLLQQWPNTLYPNGHSIVPATINAGTLLYHARKDPYPPPRTEWLAFDAEYSYEVMVTWGAETFLNTYASIRPLRVIYIDGSSSVLGETGPLDSQSVLVWGNVSLDQQQNNEQELERAMRLCELGKEWGFEGVVRMNAGFELLWCDFDQGLEFMNRINITDPNSDLDRSVPSAVSSMTPFDLLPWKPCEIAPDLCKSRFPRPVTGPFASLGKWERQRAATRHYHSPGEIRIKLDLASFITFYDPAITSLARIRRERGIENKRERQRILGITEQDVEYVTRQLKEVLEQKGAEYWRPRGSGLDWGTVAGSVIERYGDRLAELRWVLQPRKNVTMAAARAQGVVYAMLMPYVDMAAYSTENLEWQGPAEERCNLAFTRAMTAAERADLTPSEVLIKSSIEGVLARICATLVKVLGESQYIVEGGISRGAASVEKVERAVLKWRADVGQLMDWLGWSTWIRCEEKCAWDEICKIPMWPVSGGPQDGRHESDTKIPIVPTCVALEETS